MFTSDTKSKVSMVPIGKVAVKVNTWNPIREAPDDSFKYVDLSSVDQQTKTIIEAREIVGREAPSRARQVIATDDVLVATVRPNLNGVAKVSELLHEATASTGFCVIRPDSESLDSNYLFHWVKTPAFVADMVRKSTGANYPAVSDRIIFESTIPLPPLSEQKRIAEILDRTEALRAKRRAALALLDELTQSIFLDMFGDPVSNPKGWDDSKTLADVASIGSGITKGRRTTEPVRTVPYLAVVNVQDKTLDLSVVKIIDATEKEIERYRLKKNDLLLTEGGDADKLGRGTLWSEELPECIHQNHIFRVRIESKDVSPLFLNWLVGGPRGKGYFLRQAKQTTGIATINMTQLKSFPMLLPPLSVQDEFANRIRRLEGMRMEQKKSLTQLDQLFASLQHRAFRGEL